MVETEVNIHEDFEGINSPFLGEELRVFLNSLKRNTSPGGNGITYGMLKHLPDEYLYILFEEINGVWNEGSLPPNNSYPKTRETAQLYW